VKYIIIKMTPLEELFIKQLKEERILIHSGNEPITTYLNDEGEEKKDGKVLSFDKFGRNWNKNCKSTFDKKKPTHVVKCGRFSGVTVIDFDDESQYRKMTKKYPELNDLFTVKTRKGYHIYGLYDANLKQTTNILPAVDIRNEGGCVFAPPTKYSMVNGEETGYKVFKTVAKIKTPFPSDFVEMLISKKEKTQKKLKTEAKKPEFINQLREEAEQNCPKPEFIKKCLDLIADKYKNNFDDYYRIVIACSNYHELKEYCREKMVTTKYPESAETNEAFEYWWNKYSGKQSCGLATICGFAKLSSPKEFGELYLELPDAFDNTNYGMAVIALMLLDDKVLWDADKKRPVVLDDNTQYWKILDKDDTKCEYLILNALRTHYQKLLVIIDKQLKEVDDEDPRWKILYAKGQTIQSSIQLINAERTLKNVSDMFNRCLREQTGKEVKFGVVPHLLPFRDGWVLDLIKIKLRRAKREDLITRHTNTIFTKPSDENISKMRKIINQILPIPEYKKTYLNVMWSCLYGKMPEKIVFAVGAGRNGKSKINTNLLRGILGERSDEGGLYLTGEVGSIMGKEQSGGANVAMANLDGMRAVVYGEPPKNSTFAAARIKLMTGQATISARMLYSNKTRCDIYNTPIIEANKMSKLDDDGISLEDRIIILPFISYFTNDKSLWDESKFIYPKDERLDVYLDENWNAFLILLMEHAKTMNMKYGINLNEFETPKMRQRVIDYVALGNDLYQFIKDTYEFTNDDTDVVSIQEVKAIWTGKGKRVSTAEFIQQIKDNNLLRKNFIADATIGETRIRNSLIRMRLKDAFGDEENDLLPDNVEIDDEEEFCDGI